MPLLRFHSDFHSGTALCLNKGMADQHDEAGNGPTPPQNNLRLRGSEPG